MSEQIRKAAYERVRKTFQPGPHKGGYVTGRKSVELKGRQFGPGPTPSVGPKNPLISGR